VKALSVALVVLFASVMPAAAPSTQPEAAKSSRVRIVLAGDSTVTGKAGWGDAFAKLFNDDVIVLNLSAGGRSSKSFINEGRWTKCLEEKPDYVFIQFGHNDQPGKGNNRETDVKTEYPKYMTQYVDDARAAGIKPILVTSLARRQWGKDGKIHSTLIPYVEVVKQISADKNVPLIDLHERSIQLYEKLGKQGCIDRLSPVKEDSTIDNTHLTAKGAELVAPLVADELKKVAPELASYLKSGN